MARRQRELELEGANGVRLAAVLDEPEGEARAHALFAHCFTCTKDYLAPARIARGLSERGIAVLRFDFAGLGGSGGEFAETSFSTNVEDVRRVAAQLAERHGPARLLIGHSLGGAAVLAAAPRIEGARAAVVLGAPSRPGRLQRIVAPVLDEIRERGSAEVQIAARRFRIGRAFVDDLGKHTTAEIVARARIPLLVLHSPTDEVVPVDNGLEIFAAAGQPKSFVALDGADHLLGDRAIAAWVTGLIDAWASRYLEADA